MNRFVKFFKKRNDPFYNITYDIPKKSIEDTESILKEYGNHKLPKEGFVYWGGSEINSKIVVTSVIAPHIDPDVLHVEVSYRSNISFVKELRKKNIIQIAQVHTHPKSWVSHSKTDDECAASKYKGLLSIVVPYYCKNGMHLDKCGIHRFQNDGFNRLTKKYVNKHFKIRNDISSDLADLRND